ncbi:MAG: response regulator transcription factor [Chloroflexota bacterium]|nr:response regulator transcription factor [Chloroflexota bacterium]
MASVAKQRDEAPALKVLIADDDTDLLDILAYSLQREGFEVVAARDGREALAQVAAERPDLVVLDVGMPELDGFEVCRRLRSESSIPIIMLTARGEDENIVLGLELGADDYVTKPYSPRELIARVRALARRSNGMVNRRDNLNSGPFQIDPDHMEVRRNGEPIRLTRIQFELLRYMMANQGQVLPTEMLMQNVWGYSAAADANLVKTHIFHLRQRIEDDPSHPRYVVTVPGVGYLFQGE